MLVVVLNAWVTDTKETLLRVEHLDDLGEVGERAGQPVDLVDDHDVDLAGRDVGEQPLQRRPLHVAAGEAAVVVALRRGLPALVLLAADVGLAGLPLGVEGVELLLEPLLGRLAGVDRAADAAAARALRRVACLRTVPARSDLAAQPWALSTVRRSSTAMRLRRPQPSCLAWPQSTAQFAPAARDVRHPSGSSRCVGAASGSAPALRFANPKNLGPDQCAPVISRAILVSER